MALAIFTVTVVLVLWQPRGVTLGRAAALGAALSLLAGTVSWRDAAAVAALTWNAALTLVAIFIISRLLDEAGFFRWAALAVARRAGGEGRRLFLGLLLLGAAVSAFFTNDATVLILTPIAHELLGVLGLPPERRLPYLMACGFIADAMSLPLPVSNLTNIIAADYFQLGFARFALLMALPSLAALGASVAVLLWYYRGRLGGRLRVEGVAPPGTAIRDVWLFRAGVAVLVLMLVLFASGPLLRVPVAVVALAAAALLLGVFRVRRLGSVTVMVRRAPWHILVFALGMFIVVYGLHNAGLTAWLAAFLAAASERGTGAGLLAAGWAAAALAAVANNLPAVMLASLGLGSLPAGGLDREGMVLAAVLGVDIGPKLTPIGSLATLLWLEALRILGLRVGLREYLRFGLLVTPLVLLAALAGLWAALRLARAAGLG